MNRNGLSITYTIRSSFRAQLFQTLIYYSLIPLSRLMFINNPHVLRMLQNELDAAIPSSQFIPFLEQVKLPYLKMGLKETLYMQGP